MLKFVQILSFLYYQNLQLMEKLSHHDIIITVLLLNCFIDYQLSQWNIFVHLLTQVLIQNDLH